MQKNQANFDHLAYVNGKPTNRAVLKALPADFVVEEQLGYELKGQGEHLWCWVEKQGQNTDWVAGQLAKWANTAKKNVGFAGQKDRHAVTHQWFSIHLPGKVNPDIESFVADDVKILQSIRHSHKLQRGALKGNIFEITLRQVEPIDNSNSSAEIQTQINHRLEQINERGFANYFGAQRFGHNGNNLSEASKLFAKRKVSSNHRTKRKKQSQRNQEGLYISAVRSWMFNQLLSNRIIQNCWNIPIEGDVLQNANGEIVEAQFDKQDKALLSQVQNGELQPSGLLFGDCKLQTRSCAYEFEKKIEDSHPVWMAGLQASRIKSARRCFQVIPKKLDWCWQDSVDSKKLGLKLNFELPAGSFATMLIRELVEVVEPDRNHQANQKI